MRHLTLILCLLLLSACAGVEEILREEEQTQLNLPYIQTGNNRKHPVVGYKVVELYSRYGKPDFSQKSIEGKRILVYSQEAVLRAGDELKDCMSTFTLDDRDYVVDYHCR